MHLKSNLAVTILYVASLSSNTSRMLPQSIEFRPEKGTQFEYEMNERKEIERGRGNFRNSSISRTATNFKFIYSWNSFERDSGYKSSVDFLSAFQKANDSSTEDRQSPLNSGKSIFDAFKNCKFELLVDRSGKVQLLGGYADFKSRFDNLATTASQPNDQIPNLFSDQYFLQLFERVSRVLPGHSVAVGATWTDVVPVTGTDQLETRVTYTLTSIKEGIAYLRTNYSIDQSIPIQKNEIMKMSGGGDGVIELNAKTGELLSSSNSIKAGSVIQVGGLSINLSVKYNIDIVGKQLGTTP